MFVPESIVIQCLKPPSEDEAAGPQLTWGFSTMFYALQFAPFNGDENMSVKPDSSTAEIYYYVQI